MVQSKVRVSEVKDDAQDTEDPSQLPILQSNRPPGCIAKFQYIFLHSHTFSSCLRAITYALIGFVNHEVESSLGRPGPRAISLIA